MGDISESVLQHGLTSAITEELKAAHDKAISCYIETNPLSKQNYDEACRYMPGGNTRTVIHVLPFPLTIESGESCYLNTIDGHRFIDFLGEYSAGIYGHNNPAIKQALQRALDGGWNYGGHSHMERKLAQIVCERFPPMQLVRFVNSGTEANTMALATAIAFTRKQTILIFRNSYHGGTISGKIDLKKGSINLPHKFLISEYNDIEEARSAVERLKTKNESLAAILVEPMLGSGGCYPATPEFLRSLRTLATEHQALLILDEVMTSRFGYHGSGHGHGIIPDLITIGKWIGGGMTFGAFGGRADIMNMYDPRNNQLEHPGTFNNNVFTMSAGIAGCGILTEDNINRLNQLGDNLRSALEKMFLRYQIDGHIPSTPLRDEQHLPTCHPHPPKMFVKGLGSLMTIHFAGPDRSYLQALYYHHMIENGIYMAQRGYIALSIEITQTHIDQFLEATNQFCQRWQSTLRW